MAERPFFYLQLKEFVTFSIEGGWHCNSRNKTSASAYYSPCILPIDTLGKEVFYKALFLIHIADHDYRIISFEQG